METKHRTIVQAALMFIALTVLVLHHNSDKAEQAVAQKTIQANR